jgi:hypothetical protein
MSSKNDSLTDIWKLKQRGKRDSERHKQLIDKAIRKNGKDIISEYDIIKTDGDKKIKIPIKFLDKYRVKYGKLNKDGGSGQGIKGKPGDKFKTKSTQQQDGDGKAGNKEGENIFEAEISIDELVNIMMDELNLPWLDPNKATEIEIDSEEIVSREKKGLMPNLDIKKTLMENIKRQAAQGKDGVGAFHNNDLRFRTFDDEKEYHSNAAVYIMLDRSGSMDKERTKIAKTFYFWMVQFLKRRYKKIHLVFIAHDARAFMVDEKEFFTISSSGGTQCSTAFEFAYEHMKANHPPDMYDNYLCEISDGDNFETDNEKCIEIIEKLLPMVKAIGYGEIGSGDNNPWGNPSLLLSNMINQHIKRTRMIVMKFRTKDDVYDGLKKFFNVDGISDKRTR